MYRHRIAVTAAAVVLTVPAAASASTIHRAPHHHRLAAHHALTYQGRCLLIDPRVDGKRRRRWTQHRTVMVFRHRVTFDGVTFRNHGHQAVRVTAHCQRPPRHAKRRHAPSAPATPAPQHKALPAPKHAPPSKAKHVPARAPVRKPKPAKPGPSRSVPLVAASDQQDCETAGWDPRPFLERHEANVYRLVGPDDPRLAVCAANIHAAGVRLYVSLRFDASLAPQTIADQVADALKLTGPVWAFSIGNEQDINEGAYGTPQVYARDWAAAEPVLATTDPTAIRVYGDAGPWTIKQGWLAAALKLNHQGAQAVAQHCYAVNGGGLQTAARAAQIAASYNLPDWCSEMAPDLARYGGPTWLNGQTMSQYTAAVQTVVNSSPNLTMTSYYRWPQIGAY
jgi:hypothetical protein